MPASYSSCAPSHGPSRRRPSGRPRPVGHGLRSPRKKDPQPRKEKRRERRRPPAGLQRGIGRQSGGAISKPSKRKPAHHGAAHQGPGAEAGGGLPVMGRHHDLRPVAPGEVGAEMARLGVVAVRVVVTTIGAPACQSQTSVASTRCHSEVSPTSRQVVDRRRGGTPVDLAGIAERLAVMPSLRVGLEVEQAHDLRGGEIRGSQVVHRRQNRFFHSRRAVNTAAGSAPGSIPTARASAGSVARRNGLVAFSSRASSAPGSAPPPWPSRPGGRRRRGCGSPARRREGEAGIRQHVVVAGIDHGLVGQGQEARQRAPQHLGRALEHPAAAEGEQGVAGERDAGRLEPVGDVVVAVAGGLPDGRASEPTVTTSPSRTVASTCGTALPARAGAVTRAPVRAFTSGMPSTWSPWRWVTRMSVRRQPVSSRARRTAAASGTSIAAQAPVSGSRISTPILSLRHRKVRVRDGSRAWRRLLEGISGQDSPPDFRREPPAAR